MLSTMFLSIHPFSLIKVFWPKERKKIMAACVMEKKHSLKSELLKDLIW